MCSTHATFLIYFEYKHSPLSSATSQTVKLWSDKIACGAGGGEGAPPCWDPQRILLAVFLSVCQRASVGWLNRKF